ncbi:glycosyltransferase [Salipaludibacillus sp. CUR1]|uniref:glycosyltransferase n=1 Tax=Salipaludibacillus sp. CUR1 TaxID=2820003 RepID=UPI001E5E8850|nr:glycosyltransferase [Salipaludibacillus sp. CUR1]MCE7794849.1 glycosyltransferase [Salipaludibacillus sp. CUR1]
MEVTAITCTMRENKLNNILSNFLRQKWKGKELIIIINSDRIDLNDWREKTKDYPDIRVCQVPEDETLGSCLNKGVELARQSIISKMDDDDYYSPFYLTEMIRAINRTGADIAGKRSVYTYFCENDLLGIHRPYYENQFVKSVRGATLTFKKKVHDKIPFYHTNRGEDGDFLWRSARQGFRIYSTSKYNYTCIRQESPMEHTEKNRSLLNGCTDLESGYNFPGKIDKYIV